MAEQNRGKSNAAPDPNPNSNRPAVRRAAEDLDARRAFEQDRLHPALRRQQEYPTIKPERRWSVVNDDATAPARPVMTETLTDLAPEFDSPNRHNGNGAVTRRLSILLGLIILFGIVVLLILTTQSNGF